MKTDTHPEYTDTTVRCSCGNTFVTKSTVSGDLTVELCNECHPFFTGKQKLVDSGGRVERLNRRYGSRHNTPATPGAHAGRYTRRHGSRKSAPATPVED